MLDTGAPWYDTYETKDGKWLAVGAIEARFYEEFVERLGLRMSDLPKQHDRSGWPDLRRRFADTIAAKTRDEWERIFAGSDACVAPILALGEVADHPHNAARAHLLAATACCSRHLRRASPARCRRWALRRGSAGADTEAVLARLRLHGRRDCSAERERGIGS